MRTCLTAVLLVFIGSTSCGKDDIVIPKPPSQGTLLFYGYSTDTTFTHIFSINADGTDLRQLTTDSLNDRYPRWSPDGRKIVFVRQYPGTNDSANVTVMDADGSNIQRITFDSGDDSPSWSADGSQIAYQHDELFQLDVWVVNADGSNPHLFMPADSTNSARQIGWTKQNTLLGYDAYGIDMQSNQSASRLTRVLNLFPMSGAGPRLSPNGDPIAFAWGGPNANEGPYIYSVKRDGSDMKQLNQSVSLAPVWSPDGTRLAYTSGSHIWIMKADGSGSMQLTTRAAPGVDYVSDWR